MILTRYDGSRVVPEFRFQDADSVRDPDVSELAFRAKLVDGRGADLEKVGGFSNGQKLRPWSILRASGL